MCPRIDYRGIQARTIQYFNKQQRTSSYNASLVSVWDLLMSFRVEIKATGSAGSGLGLLLRQMMSSTRSFHFPSTPRTDQAPVAAQVLLTVSRVSQLLCSRSGGCSPDFGWGSDQGGVV